MADEKTAFWQTAEGIAYSTKQWMPQVVDLSTERSETAHGSATLEVSFLLEDQSKAIEDMKRALFVRFFERRDNMYVSQLNDTFIKVTHKDW